MTRVKGGVDVDEPELSNDNKRLLRLREVLKLIPVSRSSFYAGIAKGIYPKPIKLGARTSVWRALDINQILERGTQR